MGVSGEVRDGCITWEKRTKLFVRASEGETIRIHPSIPEATDGYHEDTVVSAIGEPAAG